MQESGETYLETILLLSKAGVVRSIDVANALGYSKPSVSRAMSILRQSRYIIMQPGGEIRLTETGREKAERIYERHCVLTEFLIKTLNVPEQVASEDACRIEHVISETSFVKIKAYCCMKQRSPSNPED